MSVCRKSRAGKKPSAELGAACKQPKAGLDFRRVLTRQTRQTRNHPSLPHPHLSHWASSRREMGGFQRWKMAPYPILENRAPIRQTLPLRKQEEEGLS